MRTSWVLLTLVCAFPLIGRAQLTSLPPSSKADGVLLRPESGAEKEAWNSSALQAYRVSSDNSFTTPHAGAFDSFGRQWTSAAPDSSSIAAQGGTLREIYLGSSSSAFEAAGYSYSGDPRGTDSFTLAYPTTGYTPSFGDHVDLALAPYDAVTFDFWVKTSQGFYTVLRPDQSSSLSPAQVQVLWTKDPVLVPTFVPAYNRIMPIETWIGSMIEQGSATDAPVEVRFALQQFLASGSTSDAPPIAPVPEPSTFLLAGVAACAALVVRRTLRRA